MPVAIPKVPQTPRGVTASTSEAGVFACRNPGMYEAGPFGEGSGHPVPVAVETFHALKQRQHGETAGTAGLAKLTPAKPDF